MSSEVFEVPPRALREPYFVVSTDALLSDSASAQTRLNQVFMAGLQDRYLSFTLSGIALDDAATGPDDALDVALLNASGGASLTGPIGMTHTDACSTCKPTVPSWPPAA